MVVEVLVTAVVGLAAGVVSGLLGVGGGILMVPALTLGLSMNFLEAKALSLFAILGTGTVGIWTHRGFGNVDLRTGALLGVSGVAGNVGGYLLSLRTPEAVFMTLFGAMLGVAAWRIWRGEPVVPRADGDDPPSAGVIAAIGLAAGVLASFFGIGGGVLFVPAQVLLGIPIHLAVGTSLVGVLINGASGAALHYAGGFLDPLRGAGLLVGAVVGARAGALLANRLPADRLRRVFAVALALTGVYMAVRPWIGALG